MAVQLTVRSKSDVAGRSCFQGPVQNRWGSAWSFHKCSPTDFCTMIAWRIESLFNREMPNLDFCQALLTLGWGWIIVTLAGVERQPAPAADV